MNIFTETPRIKKKERATLKNPCKYLKHSEADYLKKKILKNTQITTQLVHKD